MDEETKIYIIDLLIEINDIFTSLSDKLNILYFKFEPFLKDLSETPKPPIYSETDTNKILTRIQSGLDDIHHLCCNNHPADDPFFTLQNITSTLKFYSSTIQLDLDKLKGSKK